MTPEAAFPVLHKALSANDVGLTGSHQAGMHVPKSLARCGFFPLLDEGALNPREELRVELPDGDQLTVQYIYYNNRRFGGTRDEFRLTHLTRALRKIGAFPGGLLQLARVEDDLYRMAMVATGATAIQRNTIGRPVLRLSGGWVLINI